MYRFFQSMVLAALIISGFVYVLTRSTIIVAEVETPLEPDTLPVAESVAQKVSTTGIIPGFTPGFTPGAL